MLHNLFGKGGGGQDDKFGYDLHEVGDKAYNNTPPPTPPKKT